MITKSIKEQIKNYFFVNPTAKLRVRQIERELKLPLPSVIRYTKELEQEQILTKYTIGNIIFYTADRTSKTYLLEKKLYNIKTLYDAGLVDHIIEECHNPAIILFGSYSKGEDTEKSDIDLYIETTQKIQNLEQYEKKLSRHIQLFIHKNIKEIKNKHLANNIINGHVLNKYIEVFE